MVPCFRRDDSSWLGNIRAPHHPPGHSGAGRNPSWDGSARRVGSVDLRL